MRIYGLVVFAALALSACCNTYGGGNNPLIGAVRTGDIEQTRSLIDNGADPNARAGVNGWPALMHAVHKHQTGSVIALLKGGADIDARMPDGKTALMMAAGYGYNDIVRVLLDRGADVRAKTNGGETALSFAVLGTADIDEFTLGKCQTQTVRLLVDRAPDLKKATWRTAQRAGCRSIAGVRTCLLW